MPRVTSLAQKQIVVTGSKGFPLRRSQLIDDYVSYTVSSGNQFGYSVDIDGSNAIIGARVYSAQAGRAYIIDVDTATVIHTLDNPGSGQLFGSSVAIDGNYAVVGEVNQSGKIHVFNVSTGSLVVTINNPNAVGTTTNDFFGAGSSKGLDISGNAIVVGTPDEDNALGGNTGVAYVFNTSGTLLKTITNPTPTASDEFGTDVAIDGNYVIVGSPNETVGSDTFSGRAYIFNYNNTTPIVTLENPSAFGSGQLDLFGRSVAIHGNYAIVSAPEEDGPGIVNYSGRAYVYKTTIGDWSDTTLLHTLSDPFPSNNTYFGNSVSLSDKYAVIGGDGKDTSSGIVYVFSLENGRLIKILRNPNPFGITDQDYFGWASSISGNYVIVGAYGEDESPGTFGNGLNQGKAYIYQIGAGGFGAFELTIPSQNSAVDLYNYAIANGWNGSTKLIATLDAGSYIGSTDPTVPALTISGSFPAGVEFVNNGQIIGKGGNGGGGGPLPGSFADPEDGQDGGTALYVTTAVTFTNNNQLLGGGGGGGGGGYGAARTPQDPAPYTQMGGGGGGGQTFGNSPTSGGAAGASTINTRHSTNPSAGTGGSGVSNGPGGNGGYDNITGGQAGAGGAGGTWGQPGGNGGSYTAPILVGSTAGASGGAGGNSVVGDSFITWVATGTRLGAIS